MKSPVCTHIYVILILKCHVPNTRGSSVRPKLVAFVDRTNIIRSWFAATQVSMQVTLLDQNSVTPVKTSNTSN